jgi:hypothetical protein
MHVPGRQTEARRLGAELLIGAGAVAAAGGADGTIEVELASRTGVRARSVILAFRVAYRLLEAPGVDRLIGRGVHYGSAPDEALGVQRPSGGRGGGRQLRRTGGALTRRQGGGGHDAGAGGLAGTQDVPLPRRSHRAAQAHRGANRDHGKRGHGAETGSRRLSSRDRWGKRRSWSFRVSKRLPRGTRRQSAFSPPGDAHALPDCRNQKTCKCRPSLKQLI